MIEFMEGKELPGIAALPSRSAVLSSSLSAARRPAP